MSIAGCNCCQDPSNGGACPSLDWITLDRWTGSRTIPNNLKNIHLRPFQLEFEFGGTTEITPTLNPTATLAEIKAALETLSNFGTGMTIATQGGLATTGSLPGDDVWVWFDTPATTGLAVPLLRVVYPDIYGVPTLDAWEISTIREGGSGVDAIQSLKRRPGVWEGYDLDKYDGSVWQWRVIPYASSKKVPDLKELCIQQNRRDWSVWTTPFRDDAQITCYKVGVLGLRWAYGTDTSPFSATLTGGSFDLGLKVGTTDYSLTSIPYDIIDTDFEASLLGLAIPTGVGTISVGGGQLPVSFALTFAEATLPVVVSRLGDALTADPPPVDVVVLQEGDATHNETQRLQYRWPATGGSFTITVTNAYGGPYTTVPIPYDADATTVRDALLALPNLNMPPAYSVTLENPPNGLRQQVSVVNNASVTGGTFQLIITVNGATAITAPISVFDSPANLEAAIKALPNMLPTDDVAVSYYGGTDLSSFSLTFGGTLTGTVPISAVVPVAALTGGDVSVSSSTTDSTAYTATKFTRVTRHSITFVGTLSKTDVPTLTTTSSLTLTPEIAVQEAEVHSNAQEFRNHFEALNVGTIWKHYLRSAYGHADNRCLKIDQWKHTTRLFSQELTLNLLVGGLNVGPFTEEVIACGTGYLGPHFSTGIPSTCTPKQFWWVDYPVPGEVFPVLPIPHSEIQFEQYRADFQVETGTIQVASGSLREIELAFQIRCFGCGFSAEFNTWGTHERSDNGYFSPYSQQEANLYDPDPGYDTCPPDSSTKPPTYFCRYWNYRYDNVPHLFRKRWGPDGFDASYINDVFFVEGQGKAARKPPCTPDVVLMGDGYWLEQTRSLVYPSIAQRESSSTISCPPKPRRESQVEHPVSDIDRLRLELGNSFSYWGGWIDLELSLLQDSIKCKFDQFDLTDINTLILGGLPVRPQYDKSVLAYLSYDSNGGTVRLSQNWRGSLGMREWDANYQLIAGQDVQGTFVEGLVHKDFEPNTLDKLKRWLDLPGKTLVLDGGVWPIKFLSELGLLTTVETFGGWNNPNVETPTPNTLNGTLDKGIENPPGQSNNGNGLPVWSPDYEYPITNIPPAITLLHVVKDVDHKLTKNIPSELFVATTKYSLTSPISQWYGKQLTREYQVAPQSKLKSLTTAVPLVTPAPDATILARLQGDLLVPPFHDWTNYFSTAVDYPAIVSEPWRTAYFKLKITLGGTPYETTTLSLGSSAAQIQAALEAIPAIGPSLTVVGGPLGRASVTIWFDSLLLTGTDVPLLSVVGSTGVINIRVVREGGSGVDEIQELSLNNKHSQVIISGICELVSPTDWGVNYRDAAEYAPGDITGQSGDNVICGVIVNEVNGHHTVICNDDPAAGTAVDYGVDGYAWGLGLTHVVNAEFLRNLAKQG